MHQGTNDMNNDRAHEKRLDRREVIRIIGAAGAAAVAAACGSETATTPSAVASTVTTAAGTGAAAGTSSSNDACAVSPNETEGPYPSKSDIFRSDIRENRQGVPLALTIRVINVSNGCAPLANANVEIWQCDAAGNYSEYGSQTAQTYLRGIQTTDANGQVSFMTVYPGWYQGRATHIHIEVTMSGRSVKVTQIAFPETINSAVYATGVYASRGSNPTSNLQDGIFADSLSSELVTPSGNPTAGYSASYQVGVSV
jgi:protocatechuate 3,4-dioxygenase beta subunit